MTQRVLATLAATLVTTAALAAQPAPPALDIREQFFVGGHAVHSATRPMTWLHAVTAAITVGIMLAVVGMAWPAVVGSAEWARAVAVPLIANGEVSGVVGGVLRQSVLIAVAAAACLLIAPVLLYFALSND